MKVLWLAISVLLLSFTASQAQVVCEGKDKETAVKSMLTSAPPPHKIKPVKILEGPEFDEFLVVFNAVPPPTFFGGDSAVVFEVEGQPNYCAMLFKGDQCLVWGCLLRENLDGLLGRK